MSQYQWCHDLINVFRSWLIKQPGRAQASIVFTVMLILVSPLGYSADHEDGPTVDAYPLADIIDFFAFTDQPNSQLVMVMTVKSNARSRDWFSSNIAYRFRWRSVDVSITDTQQFEFSVKDREQHIECTFARGERVQPQCEFNEESATADKPEIFAGLVRDPFFSNVFRARMLRDRETQTQFREPRLFKFLDSNPFEKRKTLGLTVEVPLSAVPAGPIALVAETIEADTNQRIDRMGNVEVTNFLLCLRPIKIAGMSFPRRGAVEYTCSKEQADEIKDWYNAEDAFALSKDHVTQYQDYLQQGLLLQDRMDSSTDDTLDWSYQGASMHPFVKHFSIADYLIVDTTKPCVAGQPSYLDVQMYRYFGSESPTCGGRMPDDDVIDTLQTLMINGPDRLPGFWGQPDKGSLRSDGVDQAGIKAPHQFPWLAQDE